MAIKIMLFLVTSFLLDLLFAFIGFVSFILMGLVSFVLWIRPVQKKLSLKTPLPEPGFQKKFILKKKHSSFQIVIGPFDADIVLPLKGLKEKHLVIKFRKDIHIEAYDLIFHANGNSFLRSPRTKNLEQIKRDATFNSAELIKSTALIVLSVSVFRDAPLQFVEFELSCEYSFDLKKQPRVEFLFTLLRIQPKIDDLSRDKTGLYSFMTSSFHQENDETEVE